MAAVTAVRTPVGAEPARTEDPNGRRGGTSHDTHKTGPHMTGPHRKGHPWFCRDRAVIIQRQRFSGRSTQITGSSLHAESCKAKKGWEP